MFKSLIPSYKPKTKNIILDPITCMIKLSILNFYPVGTKLVVYNNSITFTEPNILQGIIRYIKGDGREDLHNLYNPITKSIEWYWNSNDKGIMYMFKLAINGLIMLKNTYSQYSTIQYALDHYIETIQNGNNIKRKFDENSNEDSVLSNSNTSNKSNDNSLNNSNQDINNQDSFCETNTNTNNDEFNINVRKRINNYTNDIDTENKIHTFLKDLWSRNEIQILIRMLYELDEKRKNGQTNEECNMLMSINTLVNTKEVQLSQFIESHSSIL